MKLFNGLKITALFCIIAFALSGCAPRSEEYCVKNGSYVKCPKDTPVGTVLK